MELVLLGVSDANDRPILLIDPAYTNYMSFAQRIGRKTVTITRNLQEDGTFTLPSKEIIEETIKQHNPSAIVVIPYDNPTGQYYQEQDMQIIAELCVQYNMRMISDEAYRELQYTK
jgi:aspartate aminotransferase